MLVLTRKSQQQIQIGPNITITILRVKGQTVRVGVEAPRDVCVLRTELAQRLAEESDSPTVRSALERSERERERQADRAALEATPEAPMATLVRCRAPLPATSALGPHLSARGRHRLISVATTATAPLMS